MSHAAKYSKNKQNKMKNKNTLGVSPNPLLLSETNVDVLQYANFENEYFLSIGLNSNIKESDFTRNKLNLVVVLDVSGSMSSSFSQYYYDSNGKKQSIIDDDGDDDENIDKSKLEIAKDTMIDSSN